MATTVGSGLGSSLGTASEATFGAFLTSTKWLEYGDHTIQWKPKRIVGEGLANGNMVQRRSQRATVTSMVDGDIKTMCFYKGMGQYLGALMGSLGVAPVQQGATTAYLQTHALANNYGQSLSIQGGFPQIGGLIVPRNWSGCKISKGVFECKVDDFLRATFAVWGRAEETAAGRLDPSGTTNLSPTVTDSSITAHDLGAPVTGTGIPAGSYVGIPLVPGASFTLSSSPTQQTNVNATVTGSPTLTVGTAYGTPSYVTSNNAFAFNNANFQLGALGAETTIEGIREVILTIERPMRLDMFYQDGTGLAQQPALNHFTKITVELVSDYLSDANFVGQFVSDTAQSLIWDFKSSVNAGTGFPFELKFAIPSLSWDDGAPTVTGPEIVQPKLKLTGLYNDTNTPAVITAMSTDVTL